MLIPLMGTRFAHEMVVQDALFDIRGHNCHQRLRAAVKIQAVSVLLNTSCRRHNLHCKRKDKVRPITGHEGPEGEQMYSSTLPSTWALDGGGWSTPRPGRITSGTHCMGGWVGPRAGLDECGKSRLHRDSIPGPSSP